MRVRSLLPTTRLARATFSTGLIQNKLPPVTSPRKLVAVLESEPHIKSILTAAKRQNAKTLVVRDIRKIDKLYPHGFVTDEMSFGNITHPSFFNEFVYELDKRNKKIPVVFHPGTLSTFNLESLSRHAARMGFQIAGIDPLAIKIYSDERELKRVADKASVPNIPSELSKASILEVTILRDNHGQQVAVPGLVNLAKMNHTRGAINVSMAHSEAMRLYPTLYPSMVKDALALTSSIHGARGVLSVRFGVYNGLYFLHDVSPLLSPSFLAKERTLDHRLNLIDIQLGFENKENLHTLLISPGVNAQKNQVDERSLEEKMDALTSNSKTLYAVQCQMGEYDFVIGEGNTLFEAGEDVTIQLSSLYLGDKELEKSLRNVSVGDESYVDSPMEETENEDDKLTKRFGK